MPSSLLIIFFKSLIFADWYILYVLNILVEMSTLILIALGSGTPTKMASRIQ
jgi:hypothetical protein